MSGLQVGDVVEYREPGSWPGKGQIVGTIIEVIGEVCNVTPHEPWKLRDGTPMVQWVHRDRLRFVRRPEPAPVSPPPEGLGIAETGARV